MIVTSIPIFSVGLGAQWVVAPETEFRRPSVDNLEVGLNDKLLLTGTFEAFNTTPAPGIINLNPDGTIDPDFVAPINREIYDYQSAAYLKRQPDGSFLLSGPYSAGNDYSPSFFRLLLPPGVDYAARVSISLSILAAPAGRPTSLSILIASKTAVARSTPSLHRSRMGRRITAGLPNRRRRSRLRSLDDRDLHSAGHGLLRSLIT